MGLKHQTEVGHSRGKVGHCPFCRQDTAELWFEPDNENFRPFQVRCFSCGARGPWCDCGWESAVPSWDMVVRRTDGFQPQWRGPEDLYPTPPSDPQQQDGE